MIKHTLAWIASAIRHASAPASLFALMLAGLLGQPATAHASQARCTGGTFTLSDGSLDLGWSGFAHQKSLYSGAQIGFGILSRCTDDNALCDTNADCGSGQCAATCDCDVDPLCEIVGPTQQSHCLTTLTDCDSAADCPNGVACVHTLGPPMPLSTPGAPTCIVSYFDGPLTGSMDTAAGTFDASVNLRWRLMLGDEGDRPCPRCGTVAQDPKPGQQFTCEGGQTPGASCSVDAVSAGFGGVSYDCAPSLASNITGPGLAIARGGFTTGTTTRTAQLPCKNFSFTSNPLNGTGKCLDNSAACSSNADCRRCTGDPATACTEDAQCSGNGTCAEAPDQPVSCGYWCQCGFCNDDPNLPCFENGDCPAGQTCKAGTGTGTAPNSPQQKPNDCSADHFLCGTQEEGKCAETMTGRCSLQNLLCNDNADCTAEDAGTCEIEPRSCFEPRITRSGVPSPLGQHCSSTLATCTTNEDCGNGSCVSDTLAPQTVALFCSGATASSAVNSVYGVTGPASMHLSGLIRLCREGDSCPETSGTICGNFIVEAGEECDAGGHFTAGDYCSSLCILVPCGHPTNAAGDLPTSADALFTLKAAVGQTQCDARVCDVNDSSDITATDALLILRKAVGLEVTLNCPAE